MAKPPKLKSSPVDRKVPRKTVENFTIPSHGVRNVADGTTIPWWSYDAQMLPSAVFSACREYKTKWGLNYIDIVNDSLRYSDRMYNTLFGQSPYIKTVPNQLLSLNVTASCIDTVTSKICKHEPAVAYLTQDGDYLLQEMALNLQKFIGGLFQYKRIPRLTPRVFKDACVLGTGMVHVREHQQKKEMVYELSKAYEFIFDWNSGMNEQISDFHVLKFINRYDLCREYPEYTDDILATPTQNDMLTNAIVNTDTIICAYSYNFFAKRHTVCVANKMIHDQVWDFKDEFGDPLMPMAIMRYEHDDRGFFGIGLSTKLKGIQSELNKLVRTAQMSSHLMAVPKIIVPRSADITKSALDNSMGGIIYYNPPYKPEGLPLGVVPVQLFEQIDRFYTRGFEIAGISQMSAGSQKPVGIDSGRGLETMYQIESDRFAMLGGEYEDLYIQLNNITLAYYEQLPQMNHKALVQTYFKEKEGEVLRFDDINIRRDMCFLKSFPISAMPQTPAGQTELVFQWQQAGYINMQQAKQLIRIPDTENFLDLETAEYQFILKQISDMVRGKAREPLPTQNMELSRLLMQQAYFYYSTKNLDDKNLNFIQMFINQCQLQINKVQMEAQQNAIQQQQQLAAIQQQSGAGSGLGVGASGGNPAAGPAGPGPGPQIGGGAVPAAA